MPENNSVATRLDGVEGKMFDKECTLYGDDVAHTKGTRTSVRANWCLCTIEIRSHTRSVDMYDTISITVVIHIAE